MTPPLVAAMTVVEGCLRQVVEESENVPARRPSFEELLCQENQEQILNRSSVWVELMAQERRGKSLLRMP